MDIPEGFFELDSEPAFSDGASLAAFFQAKLHAEFPDWFNTHVANRHEWTSLSIVSRPSFRDACNALLGLRPCSLLEVLSYIAVIVNETGGTFTPKSEEFGRAGHPGIAYLFDSFQITTASGHTFHKVSYNQSPNRTAGFLFSDPRFNQAHSMKPLGAELTNTTDAVWNGKIYPQGEFPTSGAPSEMGYIPEADFFKFRGRGYIQTTWRSAYRQLVKFVQTYQGPQDPILADFKSRWAGMDPEEVCTMSSTADWDTLFQQSKLIVPCQAVLEHAKDGEYLPLSKDPQTANGTGQGSVARMGERISGDPSHGILLRTRVALIAAAMLASQVMA